MKTIVIIRGKDGRVSKVISEEPLKVIVTNEPESLSGFYDAPPVEVDPEYVREQLKGAWSVSLEGFTDMPEWADQKWIRNDLEIQKALREEPEE